MASPVTSPDVLPSPGQAVLIRFDDRDTVVWWGKGEGDREILAAHDGRLLTWDTVEEAVSFAGDADWKIDWDSGIDSEQNTLMDFTGAQRRLENDRHPVEPHSAMDLWNFATDVSHTLGIPFHDSGTMADICHEKITKATVPYAFGLDEYALKWTPAEFKVVRRIMADAVHVVRTGLGRESTRPA
ncbi:hypothetical protein [Nocardioides yefusunii]|uniref:Uncharacterized protein n=1 Tax=Nocardioides yefusunii TaxID=2500546 RepID=A0ABW1QYR8_9ACTN|nr:hypothetical protein [Nocardioides yefusunii]